MTTSVRYQLWDVFTDRQFAGNQLAVVPDAGNLGSATMQSIANEFGTSCEDAGALACMLNLDAADILAPKLPAQVLSSGVPFFFVPLASRAAVDRAAADRSELARLCERLAIPESPVYVFSWEEGGDDATTYSRMFAPMFGITEDPATGGACGPLGAYVARHRPDLIPGDGKFVNSQGVKMGRPSRILISVPVSGTKNAKLRVGGEAVYLGEGALHLDA